MPISLDLLRVLQTESPENIWNALFDHAWEICSAPLQPEKAGSEVTSRDRNLSSVDLYLASSAWNLWLDYESSVPRTSNVLADWWANAPDGRAVLILDALSLREVPWLLQGASERGYKIHQARPTGAELPADTTPFAKALGFSQRSSLENNGAGKSHKLTDAYTDSDNLPWEDCAGLISAQKNWVFWHHWPDHRLHELQGSGQGLAAFTEEAVGHLAGDGFWTLVERLTTGRRLVITADHGYAATGLFPDTSDKEQTQYLKDLFQSGRWTADNGESIKWVPPIDMVLDSAHGRNRFVLGRRKWKAPGGYPTLTHGGLTVLEIAVPFMEISR